VECPAARHCFEEVERHRHQEAEALAGLTGWKTADIFQRAGLPREGSGAQWWSTLWK
jgi:hypothetical protein